MRIVMTRPCGYHSGVNQKEGETRIDLLNRNASIIRSVVKQVMTQGLTASC